LTKGKKFDILIYIGKEMSEFKEGEKVRIKGLREILDIGKEIYGKYYKDNNDGYMMGNGCYGFYISPEMVEMCGRTYILEDITYNNEGWRGIIDGWCFLAEFLDKCGIYEIE